MKIQANQPRVLSIAIAIFLLACACNLPFVESSEAQPPSLTGPSVTIQEPLPGAQVFKGDSFIFFATANDQSGVIRLDLWINGTLAVSQASPDSNGINPLSLSYPLAAVETGAYALVARAHNSQGDFSESAVHYVTVVEPSASRENLAQYVVQEGDTLESIAARLGVSVDSIRQANPNIAGQVRPGQIILIPMPPKPPAQGAQPGGQAAGQPAGQPGRQPAGPGANLPGVLPAFRPGALPNVQPGAGIGHLDPSLFPGQASLNPPQGNVTAPDNVRAYASPKDCSIRLTWSDAQNETGYRIERYEFGKPNLKTIATLKADMTLADDILPQPGKYGYRVTAMQDFMGKKINAPSAIVWTTLLSSDKCKSLPEFKRVYFQPITYYPNDLALANGFLQVTVGGLPGFRTPRGQQTNYHIGSWDQTWLGYSAPAPASVYSNPNASLSLEVQGNATDDPLHKPPVNLGQFSASHPMSDLTAPDSKSKTWLGKGSGFQLAYRIWLEDWLWDGKASDPSLPAPTNLKLEIQQDLHTLTWDYDDAAKRNLVDGFILYRQYSCPGGDAKIQYPLVLEKQPNNVALTPKNEPAGCECVYQVSAFGSKGESERSAPQKEACTTGQAVDGVLVTFVSLQIDPSLIGGNATVAEIHLFANEFKRSSQAIAIWKGAPILLKDIPLNGQTDNNAMLVSIGQGNSQAVKLDFDIANLCRGQGSVITKPGNSWQRSDGKNYMLSSSDGKCQVVVSLQDSSAWPGAPSAASLKTVGQVCASNTECNSGKCTSTLCAPAQKGGKNTFCFANSHCQSGVCECTIDGKVVPCPSSPPANISGFCADGLANGSLCSSDDKCASQHCANGICAPQDGLGQRGDYCHHDNHCANGFCLCPQGWSWGFCKGYQKFENSGRCGAILTGERDGSECSHDDDCLSNHCADEKCAPRDYTGLSGDYCHHDNHCHSKRCLCTRVQGGGGLGGGMCPGYQDFTPTNHPVCAP